MPLGEPSVGEADADEGADDADEDEAEPSSNGEANTLPDRDDDRAVDESYEVSVVRREERCLGFNSY